MTCDVLSASRYGGENAKEVWSIDTRGAFVQIEPVCTYYRSGVADDEEPAILSVSETSGDEKSLVLEIVYYQEIKGLSDMEANKVKSIYTMLGVSDISGSVVTRRVRSWAWR